MKKFKNYRDLVRKAQEGIKDRMAEQEEISDDDFDKYEDFDEIDIAHTYLKLLGEQANIAEQLDDLRELISDLRE